MSASLNMTCTKTRLFFFFFETLSAPSIVAHSDGPVASRPGQRSVYLTPIRRTSRKVPRELSSLQARLVLLIDGQNYGR